MAQLDTQILPLLPLTSGVVLPGMVVTLTIESDEARRALAASESSGGELLLVPRIGSSYAKIGTVAKVEDVGRLRSGLEALVIRGLERAVVGTGVAGTGETTWVQFEPRPDPDIASERARELSREYKAVLENIVEARGVPEVADFLRGLSDPGQVADTAGYSPDLSIEQKVEVLETLDVEQRLEKVLDWAKEVLAELELKDKIRTDVRDGLVHEYRLRVKLNNPNFGKRDLVSKKSDADPEELPTMEEHWYVFPQKVSVPQGGYHYVSDPVPPGTRAT